MKKILLPVCFVAFFCVTATAQQNELFDIDKHILKKQAEGKGAAEKKKFNLSSHKTVNLYMAFPSNKPDLTYSLPNGDKVITLSQDNMPCIVPDMKQFQTMPNGGSKIVINNHSLLGRTQPGFVPNGSLPFRMIAYNRLSGK